LFIFNGAAACFRGRERSSVPSLPKDRWHDANSLLENRQASVAPLPGIALIPLMAAVGMAVDYTKVNFARTAFRAALDIPSR